MEYCENCGTKLKENDKFCEQCGAKVSEFGATDENQPQRKAELPAENTEPRKQKEQKKERKPLTKKQRRVGASVIGIILFLFLTYQLGSVVYSQERQTDQIIEALSSKDSARLADVITSADSNFEVNDENLESFASYLEKNPNYLSEMISDLSSYGTSGSFYIEQTGKKFGLYEVYELAMMPIYGTVYTNAKGVTVSLGEKELFLSDSDDFYQEVGPFAPGILSFTAAGEVNELPITVTQEVTWLNAESYNEVNLELTGAYFTVYSDLEDADVYIDDKSIGQLKEGRGEFGPVQIVDGIELHIAQTFGDEEVRSETVELTSDHSQYEFKDIVLGTASAASQILRDAYYTASQLTSNYESYVDDYTKYYHTEGPAYEEQRPSFLSFGETMTNDEDVNRVVYEVNVNEMERTASNAFDIEYEVTYKTYHSYNTDKKDGMRHYSKEATIIFEPTNHPDRDYDAFIYEIRNEELLYEE